MSEPRTPWRRLVEWALGPREDPYAPPPSAPAPLPPVPPTDPAVRAALALVDDPELGVDLDDLGLMRGWTLDGGTLVLQIALTSAACPVGPQLVESVRTWLAVSFPQLDVRVEVVHTPPWTADAMSPLAKVILGREAWEPEPPTDEPELDLGAVPTHEQAEAVVDAFFALAPGAALRLRAPQDPSGFARTLTTLAPGRFGWTWTRRGPRTWGVRILRVEPG